ncbi:MAG TPA: hypothetical protein VF729_04910 [Solirubrobacterales bacterium]
MLLRKLTYANVVATLALFLALSGGVVMAASQLGKNAVKSTNIARNAVKSQDIASNAVKTRNLAKNAVKSAKIAANAVTEKKIAKEAITRGKLRTGTLAGLQVLDAQASNIPGLTTNVTSGPGVPIALTGTTSFTPATGKSYELLAELRATPSDANPEPFEGCFAGVQVYVNGEPTTFLGINANDQAQPPFAVNGVANTSTAVGMLTAGQLQTISAASFGDPNCGPNTTGTLRLTVVELG